MALRVREALHFQVVLVALEEVGRLEQLLPRCSAHHGLLDHC